ncbi:hypothetical protein Taro_052269 [Colocasia esculenta]|uniref:Uncharacterized protein n=1 Tax=Colocasia esculenta TaxID=4460 RepID=A0A843XI04_COLES|nr:hypothetical protein [Colocasia esculenta]
MSRRPGVPRPKACHDRLLWCDHVATRVSVATLRIGPRAQEGQTRPSWALGPVLMVAVNPLSVTLSRQRIQSRYAFSRSTPGRRIIVATGEGVASLESRRSRGNARRSLHNAFFAKFPTEPVTSEAHPDSPQASARRRFPYCRPVRSRDVAVLAQRLQQCSISSSVVLVVPRVCGIPCEASARSREMDLGQAHYRFNVLGRGAVVMADRRDWGGRGDDPEESTQWMIERIWESLTDIQMRMDQ